MSDKGQKRFLNETKNKSQKKKKNSEENKENLIQKKILIEKQIEASAKICRICETTFESDHNYRKHIFKNGGKKACKKRLENKVIIHMSCVQKSLNYGFFF